MLNNFIKKVIEKISSSYYEKRYSHLALYISLVFLSIVTITLSTYYTFYNILYFLKEKFEAILCIGGGYLTLYYWWKERHKDIIKENNENLTMINVEKETNEKMLYENSYSVIKQCLFTVLSENYEVLGLMRPESSSALDAPVKIVQKGNVYMSEFISLKKGDISLERIKEIIQLKINQKLNSLEFSGITQTTFIHNGVAFPILMVDEIYDSGSYVQIHIALACEKYINLLNARNNSKLQQLNIKNVNFHDNDF